MSATGSTYATDLPTITRLDPRNRLEIIPGVHVVTTGSRSTLTFIPWVGLHYNI